MKYNTSPRGMELVIEPWLSLTIARTSPLANEWEVVVYGKNGNTYSRLHLVRKASSWVAAERAARLWWTRFLRLHGRTMGCFNTEDS